MTARWVVVFSVDARHVGAVEDRLRTELAAVVDTQADDSGRAILSIEVPADEEVVLAAARVVRSFDVDAERLHDVVLQEPPGDSEPATVFVDYDPRDEPSPCRYCAAWRHEVTTAETGEPVLREWHRAACPTYRETV